MYREASFHLIRLAEAAPSSGANSAVIAALIGGVVAIVVALITGYFGTRGERVRRGTPGLAPSRQMVELMHDAAIAENERRDIEDRLIAAEYRVDVLERALVLRGFAPWRFVTGEEGDDHARIAR